MSFLFLNQLSNLFILTAVFCLFTFAGTVSIDTSFNGTGYRIQTINQDGARGESVVVQPNGKIFIGGYTLSPAGLGPFAGINFNPNGTLDTGFDNDGWVITSVNAFNRGDTTVVQPDGKILLAGENYSGLMHDDATIIRYNPNGTLDNTFSGNGVATFTVNGDSDETVYDMTLQTDGKIIIVGTTAPDANMSTDIFIMRLNANGTLDSTFAGGGILTLRFKNVSEAGNAVLVQADGKIVIGGFLFTGIKNDFLILRLTANGSLDTTFGTLGGFTITSVSGGSNSIRTMILQSDDKIVAGGSGYIARYTANGILDETFATNGVRGAPHSVNQLLRVENDKFLVAGGGMHVSRYTPNGTLDTSFNGTGSFSFTVSPYSCTGKSVALQTDGKIVLGGDCFNNNLYSMAVFRVQEATGKTQFDFDGDSKTDIGIYRPSVGEWWINRSSTNQTFAVQFGSSTDKTVPADFTGDGKTDVAFWRESTGEWFVLRSEDNSFYAFPFGQSDDIPAPGDFDADGKADAAVFRPSNATWYILRSSDGGVTSQQFGVAEDLPVVGDYDGDGKDDIGIYRPSVSEWWIQRSTAGLTAVQFGSSGDKTVPGDYTGDGKADIAFFRPATGFWYVLRSEDNSFYAFPWGTVGDVPTPGDYDGDGKFDAAVFRPSNSTWYLQRSTGGFTAIQFGTTGDQPIPNAFVR